MPESVVSHEVMAAQVRAQATCARMLTPHWVNLMVGTIFFKSELSASHDFLMAQCCNVFIS